MNNQFKYWMSILRKEHGTSGVVMFYVVNILMILFIILGIYLEVK